MNQAQRWKAFLEWWQIIKDAPFDTKYEPFIKIIDEKINDIREGRK